MNYEELMNNRVTITGEIVSEPEYSHEVYSEGFYEFTLSVPRLSGQVDLLPVTVSERLMDDFPLEVGKSVTVQGQFRSYNKLEDERSKLLLTVFARSISEPDREVNPNTVELSGYICKEPMYRTTPFKREICDVLIAVNRAYNKSDYIPCIAWGRNARFVNNLQVGDKISVVGRIQSREYQKLNEQNEIEVRTAYEVSLSGLRTESNKNPKPILKNIG